MNAQNNDINIENQSPIGWMIKLAFHGQCGQSQFAIRIAYNNTIQNQTYIHFVYWKWLLNTNIEYWQSSIYKIWSLHLNKLYNRIHPYENQKGKKSFRLLIYTYINILLITNFHSKNLLFNQIGRHTAVQLIESNLLTCNNNQNKQQQQNK